VTNIDISAPLGKRQFFWDGLFYWGDRINPFVPAKYIMHSSFLSNTSMQFAQVNLMVKKPPSAKANQLMGGSI